MNLRTALFDKTRHPMHNHYELGKFLVRDEKEPGKIRNCYQQRMMLVSEDFVVAYQQALEQEVGDAAGEIMYRCGFEWGRADITQFEKRFAEEFGASMTDLPFGMVLESWWWPLQAAGWGAWRYDLSNQKEGLIFVDLFESAVARSIGNVGKVVCGTVIEPLPALTAAVAVCTAPLLIL